MGKICKSCGYERQLDDIAPYYECPKCGMIYSKSEKILEDKKKQEYAALSAQTEVARLTKNQRLPNKFIKLFILIAIILTCSGLYHFLQFLTHQHNSKAIEELRHALAEEPSNNSFANIPADYELTLETIANKFKYRNDNANIFYGLCNKLIRMTGIVRKISIDNNERYILIEDNESSKRLQYTPKLNLHHSHEKYLEQISKGMELSFKCRLECQGDITWNCVLDLR